VGLHVEDAKCTRRQFLVLGDVIDQVAEAEAMASHGEIVASVPAVKLLSRFCRLSPSILSSESPSVIACRSKSFAIPSLAYHDWKASRTLKVEQTEHLTDHGPKLSQRGVKITNGRSLENLRGHLSLYVHPVICEDEFSKQSDPFLSSNRDLVRRNRRAEAELRSVYTMFIKAQIDSKVSGRDEEDEKLFKTLGNIMKTVCRELDAYQGQLLNYIIDDKGVVLIATFGLRHSTFPNMVAGRALPATLSIRRSLRDELNVYCHIGATYGKAYCGRVGGVNRHEYSLLGPSVNLAARLMCSSENRGILVDDSVKQEAKDKFVFKSLPHVVAKGYVKPVPTFDVVESMGRRHSVDFSPHDPNAYLSTKLGAPKFCTHSLIEERCLQRIDCLDVQTRNFLKSCAVLGREFELSRVLRFYNEAHPEEMIDNALQRALEEKILIEVNDYSHGYDDFIASLGPKRTHGISTGIKDNSINIQKGRTFKFNHEIWWKSLLKIMLNETKKDLNLAVTKSMISASA